MSGALDNLSPTQVVGGRGVEAWPGLRPFVDPRKARSIRLRSSRRWNTLTIVAALRAWAVERGEPPAYEDFRFADENRPGKTAIAYHFGTWNEAMLAAGFDPRPQSSGRKDSFVYVRALVLGDGGRG